jgi:hypothetical protein
VFSLVGYLQRLYNIYQLCGLKSADFFFRVAACLGAWLVLLGHRSELLVVSRCSSPVVRRLFEVNSEPHTGARPSVRLCVGLINTLNPPTLLNPSPGGNKNLFSFEAPQSRSRPLLPLPLEARNATERETKKPRLQNSKAIPRHSDDASFGMPMANANTAVLDAAELLEAHEVTVTESH